MVDRQGPSPQGSVAARSVPLDRNPEDAATQVLPKKRPVGLANVDCAGDEASLLECASEPSRVPECGVSGSMATESILLACGNTDPSAPADARVCLATGSASHQNAASGTWEQPLPLPSICLDADCLHVSQRTQHTAYGAADIA